MAEAIKKHKPRCHSLGLTENGGKSSSPVAVFILSELPNNSKLRVIIGISVGIKEKSLSLDREENND